MTSAGRHETFWTRRSVNRDPQPNRRWRDISLRRSRVNVCCTGWNTSRPPRRWTRTLRGGTTANWIRMRMSGPCTERSSPTGRGRASRFAAPRRSASMDRERSVDHDHAEAGCWRAMGGRCTLAGMAGEARSLDKKITSLIGQGAASRTKRAGMRSHKRSTTTTQHQLTTTAQHQLTTTTPVSVHGRPCCWRVGLERQTRLKLYKSAFVTRGS